MNQITLVMAYYENGKMLDRHIQEWKTYDSAFKKMLKVVLVDDGSPKDPAIGHIKGVGFPIELYRIKEDVAWGQDRARNLAMKHTKGFCLLTDMDHLLPKQCVRALVGPFWNHAKAYRPMRQQVRDGKWYKRHPNTYLLHHKIYWQAGGYDEFFLGYYGSDSVFRRALKSKAKIIDTGVFHLVLFGRDDIKDASTDPDTYGRKGTKYAVCKNPELIKRRKKRHPSIVRNNYEWERLL